MIKVDFHQVTKSFPRTRGQLLLRKRFSGWMGSRQQERFFALRGVSFTLEEGESLGLVGANGAGKTTVLSLVAGLARPDSGDVTVSGNVGALLELGSGFHPDLTGAENLRLNAALLGLSRRRTGGLTAEIMEFAEIGDFMNEPLRTYSSGMVLRLAFAVAIHMEPEILLIDEILAVGDERFQAKCLDKIRYLRSKGTSLICVSHSSKIIQSFCDKAVWLDRGVVQLAGKAEDVLNAYSGGRTMAARGM
ncbi:MAG: ABC transporter ATP-binding protein [Acidobacteria bacterium]|nr:ABC transporter ATP-binding protein [Acidobacteriota bacterium]